MCDVQAQRGERCASPAAGSAQAGRPEPAGEPDAGGALATLAGRLRSIARRAGAEAWVGWTEEDARALEAAAGEIGHFEESLRAGMRDAFEIGREYGKREDILARLDQEIVTLTSHVAREAWGAAPARGG